MEGIYVQEPYAMGGQVTADEQRSPEAEALRLGVFVIGLVLLVPGLIRLVLVSYSTATYGMWEHYPDEYEIYLFVSSVVSVVNALGCAVTGLLLVWISRRAHGTSVERVLYPTLIIIGAYLLLLAVTGLLQVAGLSAVFDDIGLWMLLYYSVNELQYFVGGLALVLIGMKRIPRGSKQQR